MSKIGLWNRINDWAKTARLDSISISGLNIKFDSDALKSESFARIIHDLQRRPDAATDVLVISAHNVDEVTVVDGIDADHECEALRPCIRSPGGSGANTAFALAHMGAKVVVAGQVGEDEDGKLLVGSLKDAGVDVSLIGSIPSCPTGRTTTLVEEGGERFIVVYPEANNEFAREVEFESLIKIARQARIVHLSSFVGSAELKLQERLVETLGDRCFISLVPGALYVKQGLDRLEHLLRHVNAMFLYKEQLEQLISLSSAYAVAVGADTRTLLASYFAWRREHRMLSAHIVVVKDKLEHNSGQLRQRFIAVGAGSGALEQFISPAQLPAGAKIRTVDTTGAGDAAAAAFLSSLLQGLSLGECADRAFLAAGFVSTQYGARTAIVDNRLKGPDSEISSASLAGWVAPEGLSPAG